MSLKKLNTLTSNFKSTEKFPALFLGHGNPMNAIEDNEFVTSWRNLGKKLPKPNAVICISAHWETKGTFVTAMENPKTIHDFYGFPKKLFDVAYPAPGSPELAAETKSTVKNTEIELDHSWGLDHGCWSVATHLFPQADVPIIQLSLDYSKPASYHYALAQELQSLRRKGVLLLGSGNMVHNLKIIDWRKPDAGYDWAQEANSTLKNLITRKDHKSLVDYSSLGKALELSVPTPEHYLPLLYVLALQDNHDEISIFNDRTIMGSISMTSLQLG